jgi:NADPH:quinone reductase-like Zn-dependent oxidoreductase
MRAAIRERFGSPDVIEVRDVEEPSLTDDGLLVRVRAASINRSDWYALTGTPWVARVDMGLRRPKRPQLGDNFAGTVEAVGSGITDFRPGDDVFGGAGGALADYLIVRKAVARKPANVTFEEAAAVPTAAITALQGLRDKGNLQPGQKVLINGASGGVGTFAVQIAKALGAEVTAVCRGHNVETARSIGADQVIDYTQQDFTLMADRYDLMLDIAGSHPWRRIRRVLEPQGTLVIVGGPMRPRPLGPVSHFIKVRVAAVRSSHKVIIFVARFNRPDMELLGEMLADGRIKPVIDRSYPLEEVADAFRYLGEGHARGKVVITLKQVIQGR